MTINEKISKIRDAFCNGDNGVFATRLGYQLNMQVIYVRMVKMLAKNKNSIF